MRLCKFNVGCECETRDCDNCGWNPDVAERRQKEISEGFYNKLYRIPFTGYCEVWAKTPEEAVEKAYDEDMYFVKYDFGEPVRVMVEVPADE